MNKPSNSPKDSIALTSALNATADYLYKIDGDVTSEQYQTIDRLRQLINECFVHEHRQVSSQFIYDQIKELLNSTPSEAV